MRRKKISKRCLAVLLLLAMVLAVPMTSQAAKKPSKKTVKKLYTEFLKNQSGSDYFTALDINRDGVKELIVSKPRRNSYSNDIFSIYTVKSGKVQFLGDVQESISLDYSPSKKKAVYYNKKQKAIRGTETGPYTAEYSLYRMSGSKLKKYLYCMGAYNRYQIFQVQYPNKKAKNVSESTHDSFQKKYMKTQCTKKNLVANTEKNRTKYL